MLLLRLSHEKAPVLPGLFNALREHAVAPVHAKAVPVILTTEEKR
jgi:hypothetical protein